MCFGMHILVSIALIGMLSKVSIPSYLPSPSANLPHCLPILMIKKLLVKHCNDFALKFTQVIWSFAIQITCSGLNLPVMFEAQCCSKYSASVHGKLKCAKWVE